MKERNNPSNGSFSFKDPFKKPSSGVSVSHSLNVKNFSELISLADVIRNRLLSLLPQLNPNQGLVGDVAEPAVRETKRQDHSGQVRLVTGHTHTRILSLSLLHLGTI